MMKVTMEVSIAAAARKRRQRKKRKSISQDGDMLNEAVLVSPIEASSNTMVTIAASSTNNNYTYY